MESRYNQGKSFPMAEDGLMHSVPAGKLKHCFHNILPLTIFLPILEHRTKAPEAVTRAQTHSTVHPSCSFLHPLGQVLCITLDYGHWRFFNLNCRVGNRAVMWRSCNGMCVRRVVKETRLLHRPTQPLPPNCSGNACVLNKEIELRGFQESCICHAWPVTTRSIGVHVERYLLTHVS